MAQHQAALRVDAEAEVQDHHAQETHQQVPRAPGRAARTLPPRDWGCRIRYGNLDELWAHHPVVLRVATTDNAQDTCTWQAAQQGAMQRTIRTPTQQGLECRGSFSITNCDVMAL